MPKSLRSIIDGEHDSAYVKAAQTATRNVDVIRKHLEDPKYRANNKEHNLALYEAVTAGDIEIVSLILQRANADLDRADTDPEIAINPYDVPERTLIQSIGIIVDSALRHADKANSELIRLLLKQPRICEYLRNVQRNAYSFGVPLDTFLNSDADDRTKCEFVQIAASGIPRNMPDSLKQKSYKRKGFDAQRKNILWQFKSLTRAANDGLKVKIAMPECIRVKALPSLPLGLIRNIYDFAIGEHDLLDLPVSKAQILATAQEGKNTRKNKKLTRG